jgi:3-hydroxyacyl-CoA dehydrogenase
MATDLSASGFTRIGFIGLGVMGEPMCRNLARKAGLPVIAFDLDPAPLQRLAAPTPHVAWPPLPPQPGVR